MLRALAHHVLGLIGGNGGQAQIAQHAVQCFVEVTHGVHHGAIQIDDDGVYAAGVQGIQVHRKKGRKGASTAMKAPEYRPAPARLGVPAAYAQGRPRLTMPGHVRFYALPSFPWLIARNIHETHCIFDINLHHGSRLGLRQRPGPARE